MKIAMMTLDMGRQLIAATAVGIAQRGLDECVKYARQRFPEKTFPGETFQFKLADMHIQVEAARQTLHYAASLHDLRQPYSTQSAIAKAMAGDTAVAVTSQAVSLTGSYGYTTEIAKLMRDAKIMQIYEGTNQIQRLVISRAVLAPPPMDEAQKGGKQ